MEYLNVHSFRAFLYMVCAYSELEAQGADRIERQACVAHKALINNCHDVPIA